MLHRSASTGRPRARTRVSGGGPRCTADPAIATPGPTSAASLTATTPDGPHAVTFGGGRTTPAGPNDVASRKSIGAATRKSTDAVSGANAWTGYATANSGAGSGHGRASSCGATVNRSSG